MAKVLAVAISIGRVRLLRTTLGRHSGWLKSACNRDHRRQPYRPGPAARSETLDCAVGHPDFACHSRRSQYGGRYRVNAEDNWRGRGSCLWSVGPWPTLRATI